MKLSAYLGMLIKEFTTGPYQGQVQKAREEFFEQSGTVHEDSPVYKERMDLFLDWYVFDRKLEEDDLTPVELFIERNTDKFSNEEKQVFDGMIDSISSLYLVKEVSSSRLRVKDMFTGKSYKVEEPELVDLLNKGDIFQGRIVPFMGGFVFSEGFCFHDQEARSYMESEIRKIKSMPKHYHHSFMMKLALMKLKTMEYNHVPIKYIYSDAPKVSF